MASRSKVLVRASVTALVLGLLAALLASPKRRPGASAGSAALRERVSTGGLVLVTAPELKARIARSKSRGVLVGAWASWCGSCKEDVPLLIETDRRYSGRIDVLLVSVDEPEAEPRAVEMLRQFGAEPPAFVVDGPLEAFKLGLHPRWPGMLPATFLFDTTGKVRYFWGGPVMEKELVPILDGYLRGEPIDGEATFGLAPGAVTP
jgi:cytochrome c biogenesis protein CcmG/thiol:disulfide interchange protein DsbE